ncbi:hypothetical protein NQ314_021114 [Rhamnusium bicolor]|uniref:G-protein coupled receptors family 1 profile domain-containing protein n=1 Tax=Rhamnusium bicolor TaxID=1586634 RepID=A0AAV8WJR8_9CUCU|nr:hypothetical protein NQ314_021114 [Rhamnusium bicolor]
MNYENIDWGSIDTSNTLFINSIWISKDASEMIIKTTIFLPVILFGLFGNIVVIYILVKNHHIRTPTNLLIGNMAVADLLSLLIHPWVILTYDFFQNYQLGQVGCQGEGAMECSILIASVISMSAITYDRLTAIVLPKETRLNKNGVKILMLNKYEKMIVRKLQHHHVSYKKRAAKMMFIIIVTFMICRLPFTALIIYRHQLIKVKKLSTSNDVQNQVGFL